jgi:hypothetical protein
MKRLHISMEKRMKIMMMSSLNALMTKRISLCLIVQFTTTAAFPMWESREYSVRTLKKSERSLSRISEGQLLTLTFRSQKLQMKMKRKMRKAVTKTLQRSREYRSWKQWPIIRDFQKGWTF